MVWLKECTCPGSPDFVDDVVGVVHKIVDPVCRNHVGFPTRSNSLASDDVADKRQATLTAIPDKSC